MMKIKYNSTIQKLLKLLRKGHKTSSHLSTSVTEQYPIEPQSTAGVHSSTGTHYTSGISTSTDPLDRGCTVKLSSVHTSVRYCHSYGILAKFLASASLAPRPRGHPLSHSRRPSGGPWSRLEHRSERPRPPSGDSPVTVTAVPSSQSFQQSTSTDY